MIDTAIDSTPTGDPAADHHTVAGGAAGGGVGEPSPPTDHRDAAADPPPVLPYAGPSPGPRALPGDQMAFGFGCLLAVLSPLFYVAAAIVFMGTWRLVTARDSNWPWRLALAVVVGGHLWIGMSLGLRGGRWGYLQGVAVSAALATAVALAILALR
jgi:hypothetical protein